MPFRVLACSSDATTRHIPDFVLWCVRRRRGSRPTVQPDLDRSPAEHTKADPLTSSTCKMDASEAAEPMVCLSDCSLPTEFGDRCELRIFGAKPKVDEAISSTSSARVPEWVACAWGNVRDGERVHVRVHDACLTSEILGSLKCDCAHQLRLAQAHLAREGGVLIYTPQEGRGIGLAQKVAAYALQERHGLDTVDANVALGLPAEARDYRPVRAILEHMQIRSIVLLTNNPFKVESLRSLGIAVEGRQAVLAAEHALPLPAADYLRAKARRMGHLVPDGHEITPMTTPSAREPLRCIECVEEEEPEEGEPPRALVANVDASRGIQQIGAVPASAVTSNARAAALLGDASTIGVNTAAPRASPQTAPFALAAGPKPLPLPSMPAPRSLPAPQAEPPQPRQPMTALASPHASKLPIAALGGDEEGSAACAALLKALQTDMARHEASGASEPYVTLTYAQALDGSIAGPLGASGPRLMLSGDRSMALTHALRAVHEAILIGVGTVESDDPQLTVRLVQGRSPLRVVLDSQLRVPISARALRAVAGDRASPASVAAVHSQQPTRPHSVVLALASTLDQPAGRVKAAALEAVGTRVIGVAAGADGRVCLRGALRQLSSELGVRSVMVEGGAAVIASCARSLCAHRVVVTLAPKMLVSGLRPSDMPRGRADHPPGDPDDRGAEAPLLTANLREVRSFCLGDDVVVSGTGPRPSDRSPAMPRARL